MTTQELRFELHKIFPEWEPNSLPFQRVEQLFQRYYSQNSGKPLVSGSLPTESKLVVAAQFCPKCNPNTWGNYMFQILPDVQVCGVCGHEHRYNAGGNDH